MKIALLKSSFKLAMLACITYWAVFVAFPVRAVAYDLIYTIQTGCHGDFQEARQQYNSLINALDKKEFDFLRIEEIGRSYCVRVGKFDDNAQANKFYLLIRPLVTSAHLMQAYILEDRIKTMFFHTKKIDDTASKISSSQKATISEHEIKGDMYVAEKRLLSAAEEYRLATNDDPDNPELTWKLARIYYQLQLMDDASRMMQKAIDLSQGTNTVWRTELAELYYNNGRYEEAIPQFVKVLEVNPEAPNINYYLGMIYLNQNRLDNAKEQFFDALIINPGQAATYYHLGRTYFQKNNHIMAWTAALTAQGLGYESKDLINELEKLSQKPAAPWDLSEKDLLIRYIIVPSRDRAEDIIFGLQQGERFESLVNDELDELGKTLEYRDPSKMDPKIAEVAQNLEIFAEPVIVKAQIGFHVIQRIPPITVYAYE
jgi:tetratricopeptide (TPR) repeat protein